MRTSVSVERGTYRLDVGGTKVKERKEKCVRLRRHRKVFLQLALTLKRLLSGQNSLWGEVEGFRLGSNIKMVQYRGVCRAAP